jgi:hypothetical protein
MSYSAVVAKLQNVRKHPTADRLQLALVRGYQIVVGLDDKEGTLGIFFPCDGQLDHNFCLQNDLYPRVTEDGKKAGGFIDPKHRRVRSQKFRQEKSEGFWLPLKHFEYTKGWDPQFPPAEGFEFTELNGQPICNKYMTKATQEAAAKNRKKGARRETIMFLAHIETEQFRKHIGDIKGSTTLIFTEKLHGTSQRYGHVLHDDPLPWWKRLLSKFGCNFEPTQSWQHIIGTRNVIVGDTCPQEPFREQVVAKIKGQLRKGETLYFEVVGWMGANTIMPIQDASKMQDKEVAKKYGPQMVYSYGCPEGTCELFVYRITHTNLDGHAVELPWIQVKARCKELGIKHVPELCPTEFMHTFDAVYETLVQERVASLVDGASTLDPKHVREGVCIRSEQDSGLIVLKEKSFIFKVLEGITKEDEQVVDLEEVS